MKRWLCITREPIDSTRLHSAAAHAPDMGALIVFLGIVRGTEDGLSIEGLDYESFIPMAEHQFHRIFDEVEQRWPIDSVRLVHRLGPVRAGEPSLWVEVIAPHRGEAFAACQFLIDEMKRLVPIWKKTIRP